MGLEQGKRGEREGGQRVENPKMTEIGKGRRPKDGLAVAASEGKLT